MKNLKENKGITLLALIVTIIVLLILSGISIAMLVGENGIYNNAKTAKILTDQSYKIEKINLAIASARITGLGKVDETELKKELTNYFGTEGTDYKIKGNQKDGYWLIVTDDDITDDDAYFIKASGELETVDYDEATTQIESLILALVEDLGRCSRIYIYNNKNNITDGSITVTLPNSGTVNITAVEDTSNITSGENYWEVIASKNGTYTFTASDGENETELNVEVKNIEQFTSIETLAEEQSLSYAGGKTNAYTYKGAVVPKGYFVDTKSEVNTGLVITDAVDGQGYSTGNEWVWVPVNSTVGNNDYYQLETGNMYGATSVSYSKYSKLYSFLDRTRDAYGTFYPRGSTSGVLGRPGEKEGYKEPAICVGYDEDNLTSIKNRQTNELFTSTNTIEDLAVQYVTDYNSMVTSVDTYGGFYIGRYETSPTGESAGWLITDFGNWYEFYNGYMSLASPWTETGMIYGSLWDAVMSWLAVSGYSVGRNGTHMDFDSGNFEGARLGVTDGSVSITWRGPAYTGSGWQSQTKLCNIYDLSGNFWEWTQEAGCIKYGSGWSSVDQWYRVQRGR